MALPLVWNYMKTDPIVHKKKIRACFEIILFILLPVWVLLFYIPARLTLKLLQYKLHDEE